MCYPEQSSRVMFAELHEEPVKTLNANNDHAVFTFGMVLFRDCSSQEDNTNERIKDSIAIT
jgi:hypothetical protein